MGQHGVVYPSAVVVEMPPDKYTFRYVSEKRSQGTVKVRICVNDYEGPVKAVLACVTDVDPPMPHPHMVMCPHKHECKDGVCTIQKNITKKNNEIMFSQVGILRVKREQIEDALRIRTRSTDYPFVREYNRNGRNASNANLTRVRFACQLLMPDAKGALRVPLRPVVTSLVTHYAEKLKIKAASHEGGVATGGIRVFLFTCKLPSLVNVVFREMDSDWRAEAGAVEQHMKVALQFTTPPYHNPYCHKPVKVYYFMKRPVDDDDDAELLNEQNRRDFIYFPIADKDVLEGRRQKKISPMAMQIINGVENGVSTPAAAAAAVQASHMQIPTLQHLYEDSNPFECEAFYLDPLSDAWPCDPTDQLCQNLREPQLYQNPPESQLCQNLPESQLYQNPPESQLCQNLPEPQLYQNPPESQLCQNLPEHQLYQNPPESQLCQNLPEPQLYQNPPESQLCQNLPEPQLYQNPPESQLCQNLPVPQLYQSPLKFQLYQNLPEPQLYQNPSEPKLHLNNFNLQIYQNPPEPSIQEHQRHDNSVPEEITRLQEEYPPEAMQIDAIARHSLVVPLQIDWSLLQPDMEVDETGNELYLPDLL